MYNQECCQIICDLLGWNYLGNKSKGIGIFGKCITFVRTDEEEGREMLHSHWSVWIEGAAFSSSKLKTVTLKNSGRPFFVTGAHDGFSGMCVLFCYLHVMLQVINFSTFSFAIIPCAQDNSEFIANYADCFFHCY